MYRQTYYKAIDVAAEEVKEAMLQDSLCCLKSYRYYLYDKIIYLSEYAL